MGVLVPTAAPAAAAEAVPRVYMGQDGRAGRLHRVIMVAVAVAQMQQAALWVE